MITFTINGIDRTDVIQWGVKKTDSINQRADVLSFDVLVHSGQTYRPAVSDEVIMYSGADVIYGGKILSIDKSDQGAGQVLYSVTCKDFSFDFDRVLLNEGFDDTSVDDIVTWIAGFVYDETGITFTTTHVDCPLIVKKITFDRITATASLQKLADLTGYSWYIDYEKDIHFFEKNTEPAPFNITDGDGNHINRSLSISNDLSQIRNRVYIKGAEIEGDTRTETFNGDGAKKQFKLSNKFSSLPTVSVGGVSKTVGVDFLSNEDDYQCFWDYNNSYVRFKDTTIPGSGTNNISVSGKPLYTLEVQVEDPDSILEYGVFEYAKTDKTIKAREQAVSMAKSEIEAYKNGVIEGSFTTYTPGIRSGQIININSTLLDVNEDFLIQNVSFSMVSRDVYSWKVTLATLRTVSIIDFLIGLLKTGERVIEESGETVLEKTVFPNEYIVASDSVEINTDDLPQTENADITEGLYVQALNFNTIFVAGPYIPDPSNPSDTKRVFTLNGSRLG